MSPWLLVSIIPLLCFFSGHSFATDTTSEAESAAAKKLVESSQQYVNAMDSYLNDIRRAREAMKAKASEELQRLNNCHNAIPAAKHAKILQANNLIYPDEARAANQRGKVELCLLISSDGRVKDSGVVQTSFWPLLDEAALQSAMRWKYEAASDQSGLVDEYIYVPILYRLEEELAPENKK